MADGSLKMYENSINMPQYMVSNLLIQSRGIQEKLLAVEMKRKGNYKNVKEDKQRLKSLVSSSMNSNLDYCVHDTLIGAYITYSKEEVRIQFFENNEDISKQTSEITLYYDSIYTWVADIHDTNF